MLVVVLLVVVTGGKQSQLLLQPTKVELGLQVGVEFDKSFSQTSHVYEGLGCLLS